MVTPAIPVHKMVGRFCDRGRHDPLLGTVFTVPLGETDAAWTAHLDRLVDFWSSVMQGIWRYHGDLVSSHLRLPNLTPIMSDRWLALFQTTCHEVLQPDEAPAFGMRAEWISRSLHMGLFERKLARKVPYQAADPPSG